MDVLSHAFKLYSYEYNQEACTPKLFGWIALYSTYTIQGNELRDTWSGATCTIFPAPFILLELFYPFFYLKPF